jgi:hypothetical protein
VTAAEVREKKNNKNGKRKKKKKRDIKGALIVKPIRLFSVLCVLK